MIDDGSTDHTRDVLSRYGDQITVLENDRNSGKGYSVRRGMLAVRGRYIFFTDADIPFTLEPIGRFLDYLDKR